MRGQHEAGKGPDGVYQPGYRDQPTVDPRSNRETFAAVRLFIDNERWHGIPIYLRCGKAVSIRATYAVVEFKTAPPAQFQYADVAEVIGNRLLFQIAPSGVFPVSKNSLHERVILNCMKGNLKPFMRTDLVEASCRIVQAIREAWSAEPPNFPNYSAGTSGPREAADLLARDGRSWAEIAK